MFYGLQNDHMIGTFFTVENTMKRNTYIDTLKLLAF
jgi:hypothetical protein